MRGRSALPTVRKTETLARMKSICGAVEIIDCVNGDRIFIDYPRSIRWRRLGVP